MEQQSAFEHRRSPRPLVGRSLAILFTLGLLLTAYMYRTAIADPVVRRDTVHLADWPQGVPSATILIASDLHVAGPDMPPARVARLR